MRLGVLAVGVLMAWPAAAAWDGYTSKMIICKTPSFARNYAFAIKQKDQRTLVLHAENGWCRTLEGDFGYVIIWRRGNYWYVVTNHEDEPPWGETWTKPEWISPP